MRALKPLIELLKY